MRTYLAEISTAAKNHGLDPLLVEAIVQQESAGNTDAFRFEPKFYSRYLKVAPDWAWARQQWQNPRRISSSYGLMQVMWPVAVERGYPRDLAPESMFVPAVGLEWGCRQLQWLQERIWKAGAALTPPAGSETLRASLLASYNGGTGGNLPGGQLRNGKYAREVDARYQLLKGQSAGS